MNRREFAKLMLLPAIGCGSAHAAKKYFRVGKRREHWWFLTPDDQPFFSMGMNHIDPGVLLYPENLSAWREKYGNDRKRWIEKAVAPDLRSWGFNTIGWTQEVAVRASNGATRHSREFTYEEYQWAGMPYCHMLPFVEAHQWDFDSPIPDFHTDFFEQWCDFVARSHCAQMAEDPGLIGYFYVDCPTWVHTRSTKPAIFDPKLLDTAGGRQKLFDLATRYYKVTHDAIRRYDPNHLILGDRYEAKAPVPAEVLRAAAPYVDVLSFQYFDDETKILPDFARWHAATGLPVLLADAPAPGRNGSTPEVYSRRYETLMRALRSAPSSIGWHVCGAYLTNRVRRYGFLDEHERPLEVLVAAVRRANLETEEFVRQAN